MKLCVISRFPSKEVAKDGMMQRVIEMDKLLGDLGSVEYFNISFKRNLRSSKSNSVPNQDSKRFIEQYYLNAIVHQIYMFRLFKDADLIYVHSIINFLYILPLSLFLRTPVVIDVHGTVPEEYSWQGKRILSRFYKAVERISMKISSRVVVVSHAMKSHYLQEYKWLHNESIFLFPIHDSVDIGSVTIRENNSNILPSVVYAGGTQSWQNIDLMIELAVRASDYLNFSFFVPRDQILKLHSKVKNHADVQSVAKSELIDIYRQCDLGLLLRDDILLNRVASPTKLNEYISQGVIPVLLQPNVGDFTYYGYKYVSYNDLAVKNLPSAIEMTKIRMHNMECYKAQLLDINAGKEKLVSYINSLA
ncbi:glycosyltransferase [Deinococcus ruber]|uniref:Glycosyltransferase subfamily 4-like N-terminal domain-containing protein n=1 Tax=Deinococcus ruber TaxID=1848197 RepID=A0A918C6U7_9DEIO|nr:glycosyltransferase [Deinococcus ruber]GGR08705.1 hypothetical protein GCM10008957_21860 [Deinococcus ruber]